MRLEIRFLLVLAAAALVLMLIPVWATPAPVGWTAYAPLEGEAVDELARFEQTGWDVLGLWAVVPILAAAGLLVIALTGHVPDLGLCAIAALACVGAILAAGFDPASVRLDVPGEGMDPDVLPRERTWAPVGMLIALAAAYLTLVLARRRRELKRKRPAIAGLS